MAVHGSVSEITGVARSVSGNARARPTRRVGASRLALRALTAILVSSMGAGSALATNAALPDDALHNVKTATEQLRLGLARSPEQKVAVLLDIAEARLREAVLLESSDRHAEAGVAVSAYGEHVARAAAQLQDAPAAADPGTVARFRTKVAKQQASVHTNLDTNATASDALGFVAEMGSILARAGAPEPHEIAAIAASAAQQSASRVEQEAAPVALSRAGTEPSPNRFLASAASTGTSPDPSRLAGADTATATPVASVPFTPATTVAPPAPEVRRPSADAVPGPVTSRIVAVASSPTTAVRTPQATLARSEPTPSSATPARPDPATKAARESANRATEAAEHAKRAADKSAHEAKSRAK